MFDKPPFSFRRLVGMVRKEVIQLLRDRLTFAMTLILPLFQIVLFGYVINSDPRNLATAVVLNDDGPQVRRIFTGLKNSTYFDFIEIAKNEEHAQELLNLGRVTFVISIPPNFSRNLVRGDRPTILLEADAADPVATTAGLGQLGRIIENSLIGEFNGALSHLAPEPGPIQIRTHALYNPEAVQHNNIVPGLMGLVLTLTSIMITSLAITRERERGTMENLLSMPTRPSEVLIGKITPYVIIGYIQVAIILLASRVMFDVPIRGSIPLLLFSALWFIAGNLATGITFSTIAKNQLQAMQMSIFIFIPTIFLSGFLFPFRGMPRWAQIIGEIFPITHFLRIARGIMLKGNGWNEVMHEIWPIAVFTFVVMAIGIKRYRQTLD